MSQESLSIIVESITDVFENYSDIREEIFKNDVLEILGDCSKVANGLIKLKKLKDKLVFSSFLKGFNIGEETEKEKIRKLKEYIADEEKAMFISQTLENVLNSKSKYATLILGYIINTLISRKEVLNPKYIILTDALTHMFDHDIKNVKLIGDYCTNKICTNKGISKRNIYYNKKFMSVVEEYDIDKDIIYLTLEKCVSYQLMIKEIESTTELDLDGIDIDFDKESDEEPEISTGTASANTDVSESYKITLVGELLYEIINRLGI